jgi:hypothetical protein
MKQATPWTPTNYAETHSFRISWGGEVLSEASAPLRRASYSGSHVVQNPEKVTPGKHSQNKGVKRTPRSMRRIAFSLDGGAVYARR